jgi:hypothetical protein
MKRGLPCISRPTFSAWKPSTSFSAEIASSTSSSSNCGAAGSCTRMPWIFGSALSAAILSQHLLRRRVGGELVFLGVHADRLAGLDLVAHVDLRGRVFADQDHRQAGLAALGGESAARWRKPARSFCGKGVAVEDFAVMVIPK